MLFLLLRKDSALYKGSSGSRVTGRPSIDLIEKRSNRSSVRSPRQIIFSELQKIGKRGGRRCPLN
jgi:hypothetical protein